MRSIKTRKESNAFDQDQKWLALWEASNKKMFCKRITKMCPWQPKSFHDSMIIESQNCPH